MTIRCATCERATHDDASNRWRPFCSERCQLVDLSRWLDGDDAIPGEPIPDDAGSDDPDPPSTLPRGTF